MDWRVEVKTASSQTPANVTEYDVVILGTPTRGGLPHKRMMGYLKQVDFEGKSVVLILTSGGIGEDSMQHFRNTSIDANGIVHSEYL